jgi:nuclear pore complex protein Nup62
MSFVQELIIMLRFQRKISNLNNDVIRTEALQAEIDQSLSYINAQQEDLSSILDAYEKQMKEVLDENNLQQPMQPADIQREKHTLSLRVSTSNSMMSAET